MPRYLKRTINTKNNLKRNILNQKEILTYFSLSLFFVKNNITIDHSDFNLYISAID